MWENYESWLHPLLGVFSLVAVILLRGELSSPDESGRARTVRWAWGGLLVSFLALQVVSVVRSAAGDGDLDHLPYTFFGISDLVVALLLYCIFVRRRGAATAR
jgi:hypothetical protein